MGLVFLFSGIYIILCVVGLFDVLRRQNDMQRLPVCPDGETSEACKGTQKSGYFISRRTSNTVFIESESGFF